MPPFMSKLSTVIDKLQQHVCNAILWACEEVIKEYKLKFLSKYFMEHAGSQLTIKFPEMPVEVSRLDFFHPSHREEWVNLNRYCDFLHHKLFWSGDQ